MAWYLPVEPPDALRRVLACSWTASPTGTHRLVPDACTDLLWISSGEIWLCGPETTGWTFALPPGTTAVGVRFRPGAVAAVFDVDASSLRDRRVRLGALIGESGEDAVSRTIARTLPGDGRREVLERFVAGLPVEEPRISFAERTLNFLASSPGARQSDLASHHGMTTRQLHRRCTYGFGYGPAMLARILRFQRFLAITETAEEAVAASIAAAAIAAGFADQAHLSRDCRAITGQTPRAFLGDYFPTFPDMSDPYKTPEPFGARVGL